MFLKRAGNKVGPADAPSTSTTSSGTASNRIESDERHCKDLLFLLLFLIFWAGMIYVAAVGFVNGEPERLIYGLDSHGYTCGTKNDAGPDLSNYKKLYFLDPLSLENLYSLKTFKKARKICVPNCPTVALSTIPTTAHKVCSFNGLYSGGCEDTSYYSCPYYSADDVSTVPINSFIGGSTPGTWSTTYYSSFTFMVAGISTECPVSTYGSLNNATDPCGFKFSTKVIGSGPCYPNVFPTSDILNKCIPLPPPDTNIFTNTPVNTARYGITDSVTLAAKMSSLTNTWNSASERFERYFEDLTRSWELILVCGILVSLFLSLFWMVLIRWKCGLMIWTTIVAVNVMCILCTLLCAVKAGIISESDVDSLGIDAASSIAYPADGEKEIFEYITYVAAGLSAILLLFTMLMTRRINVCIACMKVAAKALSEMPTLVLFPLFPFIVLLLFFGYWVVVSVYIYTSGDLKANFDSGVASGVTCAEDPNCYYEYEWKDNQLYMIIYHFFGLLWTTNFILGVSNVIIAGSVGSYYWCGGDAKLLPKKPLKSSIYRTFRYHLGSIAFGTLVISLVQMIRAVFEYVDKKVKAAEKNGGASSKLLSYLMCCIRCCLWCIDKIVKFISRNAFILIALKGSSYCSSAGTAVRVIMANLAQIAVINTVGDAFIFIAKLSVAATSAFIALLATDLDRYNDPTSSQLLSSPLIPVVFTFLLGYVIAWVFFLVYEIAVDTIIISYCEDCNENGEGKPKYAPPILLKAIGKATEAKEKIKSYSSA